DSGRCRPGPSTILCSRVDTDGTVVSMLMDYPPRIGDASGRAPITAAQNDLPVAFSPACARLSSAPTEFVQTFVVDAVEVGDLMDGGDDDLLAQVVAVLGEVDEVVTVDEDVVGHLEARDAAFADRSSLVEAEQMPVPALRPVLDEQRSEEHTSELQSRFDLVCRLLLEK